MPKSLAFSSFLIASLMVSTIGGQVALAAAPNGEFSDAALNETAEVAGGFGSLQPFTTDGCSHFPEGTRDEPELWLHCCVQHDLKYWAGGSWMDRLHADRALYQCVSDTGEPWIAAVMYIGVRAGGSAFINDPFRWGYGWPKLRGYTSLNEDELRQVQELTPSDLQSP
jgi:hypothetical protein